MSGALVVLVLRAPVRPKVRFAVVKDDPLVRGLLPTRQTPDRLASGKLRVIAEVPDVHGLDGLTLKYSLSHAFPSEYPHQ